MSAKYVLILHTHLPWVLSHGNWPHGEDWLMEAIAECYVPLLDSMNKLIDEGISPQITLDISPVLCEQLADTQTPAKFLQYCKEKIASAKADTVRFKVNGEDLHKVYLSEWWADWYQKIADSFVGKHSSSVINSLKQLQDNGHIEIMTCGATHGYLPLLGFDASDYLQIRTAVENYIKHFGKAPRGIWLPECAYRPAYNWKSEIPVAPFNQYKLRKGVEEILAEHNLEYFVTDENLLEGSNFLGWYGNKEKTYFVDKDHHKHNFNPSPFKLFNVASNKQTVDKTAAIFTRSNDLSLKVWSGEIGYPGEPAYLDFHKKQDTSMLRYWRVTDVKADMQYKDLYHPDWVEEKTNLQTNHYIKQLETAAYDYEKVTGEQAIICTPFDTELFGHWWFEGVMFIEHLLRGLHHSSAIHSTKAGLALDQVKPMEIISLPEGSWGENNNHDVWSNPSNYWTWEQIYNCELRFSKLIFATGTQLENKLLERVLLQTMRELMLLHSSDWQFLISNESAIDYASMRFNYHLSDFNRLALLAEKLEANAIADTTELNYLVECEKRNSIFPELKLNWWRS